MSSAPGYAFQPGLHTSITSQSMAFGTAKHSYIRVDSVRQSRIGTAGFEPAISCSQGRRITRLSYIPLR